MALNGLTTRNWNETFFAIQLRQINEVLADFS